MKKAILYAIVGGMMFMTFIPITVAQEKLTLDEVITIALDNSFAIKIAQNNSLVSQNNKKLGLSGFLPTLDFSSSANKSNANEDTGNPLGFGSDNNVTYNTSISLKWTLFDGFKMFVTKDTYHKLALLGELDARNKIEETVVAVSQAFFYLVQQEELLDVLSDSMELSHDRLERERIKRDIGASSSTELLNAQVSYNNDYTTFLSQKLLVSKAREDLNVLLGRNPETPIEVSTKLEIPDLKQDFGEMKELLKSQNVTLAQLRQQKELARNDRKIATGTFYPKVNLSSSYGYTDSTISTNSFGFQTSGSLERESVDMSIGLALSFNLFNGFRDQTALKNARILEMNSLLIEQNTENSLLGSLLQAFESYKQQKELMVIVRENLRASEQNLDVMDQKLKYGAVTPLEFRDAQISLNRTKTTLISAQFQTQIAYLQLLHLSGQMMETIQ